jgi:hypothetical protein
MDEGDDQDDMSSASQGTASGEEGGGGRGGSADGVDGLAVEVVVDGQVRGRRQGGRGAGREGVGGLEGSGADSDGETERDTERVGERDTEGGADRQAERGGSGPWNLTLSEADSHREWVRAVHAAANVVGVSEVPAPLSHLLTHSFTAMPRGSTHPPLPGAEGGGVGVVGGDGGGRAVDEGNGDGTEEAIAAALQAARDAGVEIDDTDLL